MTIISKSCFVFHRMWITQCDDFIVSWIHRSRIPFATVNLITALTAVKTNFGLIGVSYIFVIFAFGWTVLWSLAFDDVYDQTAVLLLFLSYSWTHQVIMVNFCEMSSNMFMGKLFT